MIRYITNTTIFIKSMPKNNYHIQARSRKTGQTVVVSGKKSRFEAEAWRPTNNDRLNYKYFRIVELEDAES